MTTPPEEKKPGFFSRLFGGGKAPEAQPEAVHTCSRGIR